MIHVVFHESHITPCKQVPESEFNFFSQLTTQSPELIQRFSPREGRKPGVFHESPSYPLMYCFLAWRERIESTHKTHHVEPNYNQLFLNLGCVSHE